MRLDTEKHTNKELIMEYTDCEQFWKTLERNVIWHTHIIDVSCAYHWYRMNYPYLWLLASMLIHK